MKQHIFSVAQFVAIVVQFGLIVVVLDFWQLESQLLARVMWLAFAGFIIHHLLPVRFRLPFFAMLSLSLSEKQAAVGIAAVNTLASLGGFVGPTILGYFDLMGGMIFIGVLLVISFLPLLIMNRNRAQLENLVDSSLEKVT